VLIPLQNAGAMRKPSRNITIDFATLRKESFGYVERRGGNRYLFPFVLFGVREPGLYQINSLKNTDRTK
jgi:hypothetical protein